MNIYLVYYTWVANNNTLNGTKRLPPRDAMDKDTVLEDVIEEYEPANLSVEFRTTPPSSANKIFRTAKDQVSKT